MPRARGKAQDTKKSWKKSYWKQEASAEVRAFVDHVARFVDEASPLGLPNIDRLLAHYFQMQARKLRYDPGPEGDFGLKAYWYQGEQRVYIFVWIDTGCGFFYGLRQLCERLEECNRGLRKPSPDTWNV